MNRALRQSVKERIEYLVLSYDDIHSDTVHALLEREFEFPISLQSVKVTMKKIKDNQVRRDRLFRELEILHPTKKDGKHE